MQLIEIIQVLWATLNNIDKNSMLKSDQADKQSKS